MNHRAAYGISGALGAGAVASIIAATHVPGTDVVYIASIVSVLAFVVTQSLRVLIAWADGDQSRTSMRKSMHVELDGTMDTLGNRIHKDDSVSFTTDEGIKVYFVNRYLNHDICDSVLHSGGINRVRIESQQDLQNTYQMIQYHSKLIDQITGMSLREGMMYPRAAERLYVALDEIERKLLKAIPDIKKSM